MKWLPRRKLHFFYLCHLSKQNLKNIHNMTMAEDVTPNSSTTCNVLLPLISILRPQLPHSTCSSKLYYIKPQYNMISYTLLVVIGFITSCLGAQVTELNITSLTQFPSSNLSDNFEFLMKIVIPNVFDAAVARPQ